MKRLIAISIKTVAAIIVVMVLLAVSVILMLNIPSVQHRLQTRAVELLSDRFKTHIEVDDVTIGFINQCVKLRGLRIDDQRGEHMLSIGEFDAGVELLPLLHSEVIVDEIGMSDVEANIYKLHPDSATNFQFIVNALKKDTVVNKPDKKRKRFADKLEIRLAWLENIRCSYEVRSKADSKIEASLQSGKYRAGSKEVKLQALKIENGIKSAGLESVKATIDIKQKDPMKILEGVVIEGLTAASGKNTLTTGKISLLPENAGKALTIENLQLKTDNGKRRKNYGKPHRGAFDPGHVDVTANISMSLPQLSRDSIRIRCLHIDAADKASGLIIDSLRFDATTNMRAAIISNLALYCQHTSVRIDAATMLLPNKKDSLNRQEFSFSVPQLKATTQLRDISKPFAPPLSNFTTPLQVTASAQGDVNRITLGNIRVNTPDNRLGIKATGTMDGLSKKRQYHFTFNVSAMHANNGIKEQIINHFPLKKGLLGMLPKIGNISYSGNVNVRYKHEAFSGKLKTNVGNLDFNFAIDENTKYMKGQVTSGLIAINKLIGNNNINDASINATFNFSIMSGKMAKRLGLKHGPFPIGEAKGTVLSAGYKGIMLHNIDYTLASDGFAVNGNISNTGKYIDVNCDFSFNDTHNFKNMKLHPTIKLHKNSKKKEAKGNAQASAKGAGQPGAKEQESSQPFIKKLFHNLKKHKKDKEGKAN